MKKVLKITNIITFILIILIASLTLTGCVSGVVSEKQYSEIFDGVDAQDKDGNSVYYQMRTLVDNIEFNSNIQSKAYCKLDIYIKQSCQIRGLVFIIRSSENCTLKFTTFIDDEIITSQTVEAKNNTTKSVNLFFEKAIACDNKTDLYIEVEEIKNSEEKSDTKYQFDSLVIFLSE